MIDFVNILIDGINFVHVIYKILNDYLFKYIIGLCIQTSIRTLYSAIDCNKEDFIIQL